MSRILKRPMFRKGGEVMEGIMTGIKPRQNFQTGKNVQERFQDYYNIMNKLAPTTPTIDPLSKFLISGGLRGLSTTGGTTLQNLAKAYEGPTQQLFADIEARDLPKRALGAKAAELAIEGDIALEKAREPKTYESGSRAARFKTMYSAEAKAAEANPAIAFDSDAAFIKINKILDLEDANEKGNYKGEIPKDVNGNPVPDDVIENNADVPEGTIFYDPVSKVMKKKIKNKAGTFDLVPI